VVHDGTGKLAVNPRRASVGGDELDPAQRIGSTQCLVRLANAGAGFLPHILSLQLNGALGCQFLDRQFAGFRRQLQPEHVVGGAGDMHQLDQLGRSGKTHGYSKPHDTLALGRVKLRNRNYGRKFLIDAINHPIRVS
jgi:hypothetical protein